MEKTKNLYKKITDRVLLLIILITLSLITVGYASLQTILTIEGSAEVNPYIIAKVGDKYYASVQDAVNDVKDNTPTTVEMLQNSYEEVTIGEDKSILLTTNEYTLYSEGTGITNLGTLYFTGNLVSNGDISSNDSISGIDNKGQLTVSNSTIIVTNENSSYDGIGISNNGEYLTIENSNITGSSYGITSTGESVINIGSSESNPLDDSSIITGEKLGLKLDSNTDQFNMYGGTIKGKTNPGYIGKANTPENYIINTTLKNGYYTSTLVEGMPKVELMVTGLVSGDIISSEDIINESIEFDLDLTNSALENVTITYCIDQVGTCTPSNIYNDNETYKLESDGTWYIRVVATAESGLSSEVETFIVTIDKTGPAITLSKNEATTYSKSQSVEITIKDTISGIKNNGQIKYGWSESNTLGPTSYTTINLDNATGDLETSIEITNDQLTGTYYLWVEPVELEDILGNKTTKNTISTGKFYFDNEAPKINSAKASGIWGTSENITIEATDNVGVIGYILTDSSEIPSLTSDKWQTAGVFSVTDNKKWYAWIKDAAGNISEVATITNSHVCLGIWDVSKNLDESVHAVLKPNGELLITGTGETRSYNAITDRPYNEISSNITSIVVEEGVTSLGGRFFQLINTAETISLPASLTSITTTTFERTTGYEADGIIIASGNNNFIFENSALYDKNKTTLYTHSRHDTATSFTVPSTVTLLGYGAFYQNTNLTNVNISSNIDIGWSVFRECTSLETITSSVGNTTINGTIGNTRISPYSFDNTKLTNVKIGKNVVTFMKSGTTYYPIEGVNGTFYYYGSNEEVNAYLDNTDDSITWKAIATVTLDPNGGSVDVSEIEAVYGESYGAHATLPTPTKEGYDFIGWYTSETGGTKVTSGTSTLQKEDHTLYARWGKEVSNLTITLNPTSYTYDGTEKKPTVTVKDGNVTLVAGTDYTLSYSNNINASEEAIVTITGKDTLNPTTTYLYTGTTTKKFTIAKATPVITLTENTGTYNGNVISATASSTGGGTVTLTYYSDNTCTTKTTTSNAENAGGAPKSAGTYYATGTSTATTNYTTGAMACTKAVTINKKSLNLDAYSATYNGTTSYLRTLETGVGNETLILTYKPYAKTATNYTYGTTSESGKYIVTMANGTGNINNYSIATGATFTINKAQLTIDTYSTDWVSGVTVYTRSGYSTGVNGETIALTYQPYANTAGSYIYATTSESGKYALTLSDSTNYSIKSAGNFTINKINCTCTITNNPSLVYPSSPNANIEYNCTGDGTKNVVSGTTDIITVGAIGATTTPLTAKYVGTSKITVSQAAGTNYNACPSASKDVTVTGTEYTVNYSHGTGTGTAPTSQKINYGSSITIANNTFTKKGHSFAGWTTRTDNVDDGYGWTNWSGEWKFDNGESGISNYVLNLYPRWDPKTYTVKYSCGAGTGTVPDDQTVTFGSTITIANNISCARVGYTFDGWEDPNGTRVWSESDTTGWSGTWEFDESDNYGITNGLLQLTARWSPNTVSLKYDSNGGSSCSNKDVTSGNLYGTLCTPTKTGYNFGGWYLSEENDNGTGVKVTDSSTVVAVEDLTLYAAWTIGNFDLVLSKGTGVSVVSATGCTLKSGTTYSCIYDTEVTLSATAITGYENPSWSGTTVTNSKFKMPGNNLTLTASASAKKYTVTLDNQSATTAGTTSITATYNSALPTITVPTKTGYKFNGYYTEENGAGTKYINANGTSARIWDKTDVTKLYAYWTINKVKVQYHINGGTWAGSTNTNFSTNSEGYVTFYFEASATTSTIITSYTYGQTDINLYDYNNNTGINIKRTGYQVKSGAEWNLKADGTGTSFDQSGSINANDLCDASNGDCTATLYVNWKANKINVQYHMNGGTWAGSDSAAFSYSGNLVTKNGSTIVSTYTYGQTGIDLLNYDSSAYVNIERIGYQAKSGAEWNLNADGTGTSFTDATATTNANDLCDASNGDCTATLYVNWRINNVYVQFHMNGGTWGGSTNTALSYSGSYVTRNGDTKVNTYTYGQTGIDLPNYDNPDAINITRSNYAAKTGAEWNLKADGTGTSFTDSSATINANDLCSAANGDCTATLYVNWTPTRLYLFNNGNVNGYTWQQGFKYTEYHGSSYSSYFGTVTYNATGSTTMNTSVNDTSTSWGPYGLWYVPVTGAVLNQFSKANSTFTKGGDPTMYIGVYANPPTTYDYSLITNSLNFINYRTTSYLTLPKNYDASKTYYVGVMTYSTGGMKGTVTSTITQVYLYN